MKIYLSAQWSRAFEIEGYARVLRQYGYAVVSTWHTSIDDDYDRSRWSEYARKDIQEVAQCSLYLAFTETEGAQSRGGRHVEFGWALNADDIEIAVVGPVESQFYTLADDYFLDFADFLRGHNLPGECPSCGGEGVIKRLLPSGPDIPTCIVCQGSGRDPAKSTRRMQANPLADKVGYENHRAEHDQDRMCMWGPVCTPMAEAPR